MDLQFSPAYGDAIRQDLADPRWPLGRRGVARLYSASSVGALALTTLLHGSIECVAQPQPDGDEFRVNLFTTGNQRNPAVAMDADGDFVVVWESSGQDGSGYGIFAQRYAADGTPQEDEFQVNLETFNNQRFPAVAMDADGDFVVAWTSYYQDGASQGIYALRFSADGDPQGTEILVNTYTTSGQYRPTVAMDDDGDFVVAWVSFGQDGALEGVFAQRFAADGEPQGPEFLVNTITTSGQGEPSVAMDADGDFVIHWEDFRTEILDVIFARRYAADGNPQGPEFQVNTFTIQAQLAPTVAMDAGGAFIAAWESTQQDGSVAGVFGQRYDSGGNPVGAEFQVNTTTFSDQRRPTAAMDADGDFVIAWTSLIQDGAAEGVFGQYFAPDGTPQGPEFAINTFTTNNQSQPSVAMDDDGDFVVVWESNGQDGSGYGIYAQRFTGLSVSTEGTAGLPAGLTLEVIYPNPTHHTALLRYALAAPAAVRLTVSDLLGHLVQVRDEGIRPAGRYEVRLGLSGLPSGVYVVHLEAGSAAAMRRVTVLR